MTEYDGEGTVRGRPPSGAGGGPPEPDVTSGAQAKLAAFQRVCAAHRGRYAAPESALPAPHAELEELLREATATASGLERVELEDAFIDLAHFLPDADADAVNRYAQEYLDNPDARARRRGEWATEVEIWRRLGAAHTRAASKVLSGKDKKTIAWAPKYVYALRPGQIGAGQSAVEDLRAQDSADASAARGYLFIGLGYFALIGVVALGVIAFVGWLLGLWP